MKDEKEEGSRKEEHKVDVVCVCVCCTEKAKGSETCEAIRRMRRGLVIRHSVLECWVG